MKNRSVIAAVAVCLALAGCYQPPQGEKQAITPQGTRPAAGSDPYIKIVSPKAGDIFTAGQKYRISWLAVQAPADAWVGVIRLYNGASIAASIVPDFSRNPASGEVDWTFPAGLSGGSDYWVEVVLNTGPDRSESNIALSRSPRFTVKAVAPSDYAVKKFNCEKYADGKFWGAQDERGAEACRQSCVLMYREHPAAKGVKLFQCKFDGQLVWESGPRDN